MRLTIGIPTFNRAQFLVRAIDSVLCQKSDAEIIVLDDGSTDNTASVVSGLSAGIRYVRQECNQGLNAARNRILREAKNPWVFFLDDDDRLESGAIQFMTSCIQASHSRSLYPVLFFRASNAVMTDESLVVDARQLLLRPFRGDLVPLLNRDMFLKTGLSYPGFMGGEGILWLRIAQRYGIPVWNHCVTNVGSDAPNRITSVDHQLRNASKFAELQDIYLEEFGSLMTTVSPRIALKRQLGSSVYWLLAGARTTARARLRRTWPIGYLPFVATLYALSYLPQHLVRLAFRTYRHISSRYGA